MDSRFSESNFRERNFIGYGENSLNTHWQGEATIAVNFVVNLEEGAELCILNGDATSESYLAGLPNMTARKDARSALSEATFEYGSSEGFWRLWHLFNNEFKIPLTFFTCGKALESNPSITEKLKHSEHEIVSHGYRWIDFSTLTEEEEEKDIKKNLSVIKELTGKEVKGCYIGRHSPNTRYLVQKSGFIYSSDDYSRSLPYWTKVHDQPLLIIPYTLRANDCQFFIGGSFLQTEAFLHFLRRMFDGLYREGEKGQAKMMTIALHPRISGDPAITEVLREFLTYITKKKKVWICKREDIANHWIKHFPYSKTQSEEILDKPKKVSYASTAMKYGVFAIGALTVATLIGDKLGIANPASVISSILKPK